ncbi:MAG: hypothetical protein IT167_24005 [Bryobacterales bacterium]|nr:hypothetical protein [Bryobacterales bacterium]
MNLGGSDHRYSTFNTFTLLSNLSVVKGNHTVKFGWEGRVIRVSVWEARTAGTFNFNLARRMAVFSRKWWFSAIFPYRFQSFVSAF